VSRQTKYTPDQLTPEQRAEYDDFLKKRKARADGMLGGPFDPWLLNAELSKRLRGLGGMLWSRTSLDRGLVELAISITGKVYEANVEWNAHAPRAVEYGIPQDVMDTILRGERPVQATPDQLLMYDVCMSLLVTHLLPRPLYDRAVATWGERGVVEITAVVGFYVLTSMSLNAFEVEVAEGQTPPFPRED
jgi:4-carboxymuconolactone decarboxylase